MSGKILPDCFYFSVGNSEENHIAFTQYSLHRIVCLQICESCRILCRLAAAAVVALDGRLGGGYSAVSVFVCSLLFLQSFLLPDSKVFSEAYAYFSCSNKTYIQFASLLCKVFPVVRTVMRRVLCRCLSHGC